MRFALSIGDRLCLALPRAQAVEVGRVIGPQQDRLAVFASARLFWVDENQGPSHLAGEAMQKVDAMNLPSGLLRVWLVLSIAWIAYCAWNNDLSCHLLERIGVHTGAGVWCKIHNAHYYRNLLLHMVGIPALMLVALTAAAWMWRSFRSAAEKSRMRDSA